MSIVQIPDGLGNTKKTLRIEGVNLQVVNGAGTTTGSLDGLGNLIVGYNETGNPESVTTAPVPTTLSWAGNTTTPGPAALFLEIETRSAAISPRSAAGSQIRPVGTYSSVSGGANNEAYGVRSSVGGGQSNTANGDRSSVSGGFGRTAANNDDWVAGTLTEDY